jgi:hypothetical protein
MLLIRSYGVTPQRPSRRKLPEDDYAAFVLELTTITTSCLSRRPMSMAQLNPLKMQFAGMSSVGELAHYGNSPNLWHESGNVSGAHKLAVREGAKYGCPMVTLRADYELFAWWLTRERIGQDLRERYLMPEGLPTQLLKLAEKLDRRRQSVAARSAP